MSRTVCGIKIEKKPLGAYLNALQRIQSFPEDFIENCFPGKSLQDILDSLSKTDEKGIVALAAGLLTTAPKYLVSFMAELTGIDEATLLEDEKIGLDGIVEIIDAFVEINGLGKFISGVKGLTQKIKSLTGK